MPSASCRSALSARHESVRVKTAALNPFPFSGFYKFVRQNVASLRTESRLVRDVSIVPHQFDASADRALVNHRAKFVHFDRTEGTF